MNSYHYEYDWQGNLTKAIDTRGNATTYTYTAQGWLRTETSRITAIA